MLRSIKQSINQYKAGPEVNISVWITSTTCKQHQTASSNGIGWNVTEDWVISWSTKLKCWVVNG